MRCFLCLQAAVLHCTARSFVLPLARFNEQNVPDTVDGSPLIRLNKYGDISRIVHAHGITQTISTQVKHISLNMERVCYTHRFVVC